MWILQFLCAYSFLSALLATDQETIGCSSVDTFVNSTWQLRSGTYTTYQINTSGGCRYTLSFSLGTVLMVNMNVNDNYTFSFRPSTLFYLEGDVVSPESGFSVESLLTTTNLVFAAPAPSLCFIFDITKKLAEVPPSTFKAVVKKIEIIKYINYHVDINQEPIVIPIKDLRDGWALNFSATNEVILAVACPNADALRLASIHVYKDSKKLESPIATFNEMLQDTRRYLQYKNPLVYVALSYQNSNGVLLAMDSSRIYGMDWRGLYYYYNNTDSMRFNLLLRTRIVWEKTYNITRPALTLLIDPFDSSNEKILNSYQSVWLTSGRFLCNEDYKGNWTVYQGFPSEIVDEKRIIKKDRDTIDLVYLEGGAITIIYRRASWEHTSDSCFVSMDFSTTFPNALSELPFNGTITRYSDPEGKKRNPIMFNDLGSQIQYSLKLHNISEPVTIFTSDNNSVTLTETDEPKEFTSRGLNLDFISGSIEFSIEPVANTSSSSRQASPICLNFPKGSVLMVNMNINRDHEFNFEPSTLVTDDTINKHEGNFDAFSDKSEMTNYAFAAPTPVLFFWFDITQKVAEVPANAFKAVVKKVEIIKYVNYHLDGDQDPLIIPIKDLRDGWALNFSATNEVVLAVACPTVDPFRLISIHVYENSKRLEAPVVTFYEMSLTIRRYIQYKNPLIHVAMSYQNSNGILLAMDSSRITGINWSGLNYNLDMQFTLALYTRTISGKTSFANVTTPSLTLFDPKVYGDKILSSFENLWLTNVTIDCPEECKGTLTIYQGFPGETINEGMIIKDSDMVDFLYLEGTAVTVVYRRASWEKYSQICGASMGFSITFPNKFTQLPFNGTITRYPDGNKRPPIMFSDLGVPVKYSLKLNVNPDPVTVSTSDNTTVILMETDGLKEFTTRGLNMTINSGIIDFIIEPVTETTSSQHAALIFGAILLFEFN